MKTTYLIAVIIQAAPKIGVGSAEMNSIFWYTIGGCIAICLLIYLIYSLLKPEKF